MYPGRDRRIKGVHQRDRQRVESEARKGTFDSNPLLNTPHQVPCKNCGNRKSLVYLDYLKAGQFKLGETKPIEVLHPYSLGFTYEMEEATPVIIRANCNRCGSEIEIRPVSLEYLLFIMERRESRLQYV